MSNLRVCIVSPLFHPNLGGSARQAYTMADRLNKKGLSLMVITRRLDVGIPKLDNVEVHSVRSLMPCKHSLSDFTFLNFLISISFSLGAVMRLLVWRKRFEIVQFYGASLPLLLCLPLLKILRKKIVAKISGARKGMEVGSLRGFVFAPVLAVVFSFTDRFIVMSDELREGVLSEKFSESKVVKIPNGVDTGIFAPAQEERYYELRRKLGFEGGKVFLYSGRLAEGKGIEFLIKAMTEVDAVDNILLVLLGNGVVEDNLRMMAYELTLGNFLRFEGTVSNVADYLNAADIFVFPSLSEGMPNALLEAMACGLPVIASKIGGVVDVVEDGKSGILFEPGDVSGLASAMVRLLNDNELRFKLGAEARKRIVDSFSIDKIADEYINLYKEVLD